MYVDRKVGLLTAKYETSGKGPGFISNGSSWGDPGGDSYGSYQLESKKGTLQAYLKTEDKFTKALRPLKINSTEFKEMWRKLALNDPDDFEQSQFSYLANKPNGYIDGYNWARANGWAVDDLAIQSAIYSAVNQSGGWRNFFQASQIKKEDSVITQLNKLYNARAIYFKGLSSLSSAIKQSIVQNRCGVKLDMKPFTGPNERKDALKLVGQ